MLAKTALNKLVNEITRASTKFTSKLEILRRGLTVNVDQNKNVCIKENTTGDAGEEVLKFPSVWLRDNCNCAQCFHQSSQSRAVDWNNFDTKVHVKEIKTNELKKQLNILWSDLHESTYDLSWLKKRSFSQKNRQKYLESFYRPNAIHWSGKDFDKITQYFSYTEIMQNDDVLQAWLEVLAIYGVAIIKSAPAQETAVRQLVNRVGFIRKTTYGEEFIVRNKPGAKNYAYLSTPLPLHTDLPYYEYKPSVNILHYIQQSSSNGGDSLLVDAFHIADCLKAQYPEDYKILTTTLVDWNDIGAEGDYNFHNIWRAPVICLDNAGKYTRINHNIPQRDSHFSVSLEEVYPWYEAYAKFIRMALNDVHTFKVATGDILTFNNIRLLHGRTGYDDTADNIRYIVGAYMDWDIIYSRLRVLKTAAEKHKDTYI